MSAFGGLVLTNKGRNLQAKAQAGTNLEFTRIAVGDGDLGGSSIVELNSLINETLSLSIITLKALSEGQAVVGAVLSNTSLVSGFFLREVGVFATDPDLGEILYCYGNAGETADYIPAGGGEDIIEKTINITTIVGNAPNVSAVINESLTFVSYETFTTGMDNKVDKIDGKGLSTEDYTTVEKEKLAGVAINANNYSHPGTHSLDIITETTTKKILTLDERNKLSKVPDDTNASLADIAYKPAGGTADALTVTKTGFTLKDGQYVEFKASATNTGAMTINPNGLGVIPFKNDDEADFVAGDIEKDKYYKAIYTIPELPATPFFVLAPKGGAKVVHGTQDYTVAGSYNFTVPDNVNQVTIAMVGGGGGGGGAKDANSYYGGGGGGGGSYIETVDVAPGELVSVVVGAGGIKGYMDTAGTNGGNSSFGSLIAYGGTGGIRGKTGVGGIGGGYGGQGAPYAQQSVNSNGGTSGKYGHLGGLGDGAVIYGKGGDGTFVNYADTYGTNGFSGRVTIIW